MAARGRGNLIVVGVTLASSTAVLLVASFWIVSRASLPPVGSSYDADLVDECRKHGSCVWATDSRCERIDPITGTLMARWPASARTDGSVGCGEPFLKRKSSDRHADGPDRSHG